MLIFKRLKGKYEDDYWAVARNSPGKTNSGR